MTKLKVQAQHLQPGDIVGSGEKIIRVVQNSTKFPSSKVLVELESRIRYWGKWTVIGVERAE